MEPPDHLCEWQAMQPVYMWLSDKNETDLQRKGQSCPHQTFQMACEITSGAFLETPVLHSFYADIRKQG